MCVAAILTDNVVMGGSGCSGVMWGRGTNSAKLYKT